MRSADRLRPADLTEGGPDIHPDYGVFRDEDATWDHEDDNPNRDQIGDTMIRYWITLPAEMTPEEHNELVMLGVVSRNLLISA